MSKNITLKGYFQAQGTFDDDKGQKSAISGRRLHWIFVFIFSPVDFSFSPSKEIAPKRGQKWPDARVEK